MERSSQGRGGVEVFCSDSKVVQMSASVLPCAGRNAIYRGKKTAPLQSASSFSDEDYDDEYNTADPLEGIPIRAQNTQNTLADFFVVAPTAVRPHMLKMSASPPSGFGSIKLDFSADIDAALSTLSKLAELRKANAADTEIAPLLSSLSILKQKLCSSMENCNAAMNALSVDDVLNTVDAINRALSPIGQQLVL